MPNTTKRYIGVTLFAFLLHLYFYTSTLIEKIDYKFYDVTTLFLNQIKENEPSYTVIVDIDEKSLHQIGQWPWSRIIDAKLIDTINSMNPSALGVNILFPQQDRTSPLAMQEFYKKFFNLELKLDTIPKELKDNDKLLAHSIEKAQATLSTYFSTHLSSNVHCQKLLYKEDFFTNIKPNLTTPSLLCNYKVLQNRAENFGFINASVDSDGVFRRIPLFVDYKSHIFPSFALATILSFDPYVEIEKSYSSILVNFSKKPKVFSAIDILNEKVPATEIQGKIVVLGSSIVGINPMYTVSNGQKISGSRIHASVIDNILDNSFLIEKKEHKIINLSLSFLLSMVISFLFFKRLYIYVMLLFFTTISLSLFYLINSYLEGVYISIAYLWTPFLLFFILVSLYFIRHIDKEYQKKERLLIKQSKLASMGEMISLIAHQWRQPLASINGIVLNLDLDYRKNLLNSKKLNEYLDEIEQRTAYLSNTIHDFTDFFSTKKKIETFYISELILQTKKLLSLSLHKNIQIIYKEEKKIQVTGYQSELIQSLLIILNNSLYACERNRAYKKQHHINIDVRLSKNYLLILIQDTGGGVEKGHLKKIFNPYFTTKGKEHGTGLGLYILKLIVEESMGGEIFVKNGEQGAVFTLKIPQKVE
jgi:signal transduction histidine kinase